MRAPWLALLAIACTHPHPRPPLPDGSAVTASIAGGVMAHGGVPGLAIVVMRGDEVILSRGYGTATPHTVMPYASLSKLFWSTGLAQLADAGTLDVDAPVATYLPDFPDPRVHVVHLLTQTSGLGDDADGEDDDHFTDLGELAFAPGTWWKYSNRGAELARLVLDHASGLAWPDELARIAEPLGLTSVRVCDPADAPGLTAETMHRVGFVCGDAVDAARFVRAIATGHAVAPRTRDRMIAPATIAIGGAAVPMHYGWLSRVGEVDGHAAYGHSGNFDGVSVAAFTFPDDDLTIAVLADATPAPGYDAWDTLTHVARAWLGVAEPTITDDAPPPALLAACAGTYDVDGLEVDVTVKGGRLWFSVPAMSFEREAPWGGGTTFLGSPTLTTADTVNEFVIVGGRAVAFRFGHRLVQDGLARRVTPRST